MNNVLKPDFPAFRPWKRYWWRSVFLYRRNLRWAYQRVTRGWAQCDAWSMDYFLSPVIAEMARRLKNGPCPGEPGESFEESQKKWDAILDQIADGFDAGYKISDMKWEDEKERRLLQKKFDAGFRLFHKWYFSLWN
jgi:hypothetical protein